MKGRRRIDARLLAPLAATLWVASACSSASGGGPCSDGDCGRGSDAGGTQGGGGGLYESCQVLCGRVASAGCTTQSACAASCEDTSTLPATCISLYDNLIACGASSGTVGCTSAGGQSIGGCDSQAEAVNTCAQAVAVPSPDAGATSSTAAAGCMTSSYWQGMNVCASHGFAPEFFYQCNASLVPPSCSEVVDNALGVTCSAQAPCWCCPSGA
jgi:hypothetical protein